MRARRAIGQSQGCTIGAISRATFSTCCNSASVSDACSVSRTIALAHHKEYPLSHAAAAFQATLMTYLEQAEATGTLPTDVVRVGAGRPKRAAAKRRKRK